MLFFSCLLAQYIPHVALGGGYEIHVFLTNKLDSPFVGGLSLHQGNRQGWAGQINVDGQPGDPGWIAVNLSAKGTVRVRIQGDTALRSGYLIVWGTGENSGTDVAVSCFYNYLVAGKLIDSTGVPVSWANRGHHFAVEKSPAVNTGFAWSSLSPNDPFEITLELYDSTGVKVQTKTRTFAGHLALFFTEIFDNVADGFVGHVRITSPTAVGMTVLRLENVSGGFQL
ncbi:MAG: hypothetical protein JSU96_04485, partial [Acidobacteriota bacterium]